MEAEIRAFKSGEKYIRMEELCLKELNDSSKKIDELQKELASSHRQSITIGNQWFEVFEELQKECDKRVAAAEKKAAAMEERALRAERQRDAALDKAKECRP